MMVFEFYKHMIAALEAANVSEPHVSASWLLSDVLKIRRTVLPLKYHDEMSAAEIETAEGYLERRCRHEPVQYILGEWDFGKHKINVGKGVLIPRPETEEWIEKLVTILEKRLGKERRWYFADIGTGSGVIGISLAEHFPNAYGWLSDISMEALYWAQKNLSVLSKACKHATLLCGETASFLKDDALDVIVSNPPYISHDELSKLMPDVKNWEPSLALDGGLDGLDIYKRLIPDAVRSLKRGGIFAIEHGYNQRQALLSVAPPEFETLELLDDSAGLPRCIVWERR